MAGGETLDGEVFFVSWMAPIKRARMHRGECRHCNFGKGQEGQHRTGSGNTGWSLGMSYEAAERKLAEMEDKGYTDVAKCGYCLRGSA